MAKHHAFAIFYVSLRRSFEIILDMTPVQNVQFPLGHLCVALPGNHS